MIYIASFVFGVVIGSFLNVVILRTGTGLGFGGRSMCLSCGAKLGWGDLVPIISYIFLHAKCRTCDAKISIQYPLVEFTSGVLFFVSVYRFGYSLSTLVLLAILLLLLIILVYDFKHTIIPDWAVFGFIVLSFARSYSEGYIFSNDFWVGPLMFAFFATLWVISDGRWMGFGDAKLALGIGFLLGWDMGLSGLGRLWGFCCCLRGVNHLQ